MRRQNSYEMNFIKTSRRTETEFWNCATKLLIRKLNFIRPYDVHHDCRRRRCCHHRRCQPAPLYSRNAKYFQLHFYECVQLAHMPSMASVCRPSPYWRSKYIACSNFIAFSLLFIVQIACHRHVEWMKIEKKTSKWIHITHYKKFGCAVSRLCPVFCRNV